MAEHLLRATELTIEQTQHYIDTVRDAVTLRLKAGSDPVSAMFTALDLIDAWAAVHIDGSADSIYHLGDERKIAQLTAIIGEMHLQHSEHEAKWRAERGQLSVANVQLREELQALETDLIGGRAASARRRVKAKRETASIKSERADG